MKYFEEEDWQQVIPTRNDWWENKHFSFMDVRCDKKTRKERHASGEATWIFTIRSWDSDPYSEYMHFKKFHKKYIVEFFNKGIKTDRMKKVIFNKLFKGL